MRFAAAILASVGIHAALAVLAAFGLSLSGDDRSRIALDVGAMDLSFAEKESDEMPLAPMPSAPPPSVAEPMPPPVSRLPPPLLDDDGLDALPPDVARRPLPEAPEPEVKFDILEVKDVQEKKEEQERKPDREAVKKPDAERDVESDSESAPQSSPQSAPRQARVDAPPRPRKSIRPVYPDGARRRGEEGDVVIEISVDENGDVVEASVVTSSGFRDLDHAACKAVKSARFVPAKQGSRPVASVGRLTISFKLRK